MTPTYWVYWLYKVHHDATLLPVQFSCNKYEVGGRKIDAVSLSASKDASGKVHITIVNLHPTQEQVIDGELRGMAGKNLSGKIITSPKLNDYNSFDRPNTIGVKDFNGAKLSGGKLTVTLPPKSVVMVEIGG